MAEEETKPKNSEDLRQQINESLSAVSFWFHAADIEDAFIHGGLQANLNELGRLLNLANIELKSQ